MSIHSGQINSFQINGIGRKILINEEGVQVEEGFFSGADGLLEFGRMIDAEKSQIGMFKDQRLHGQGKRINPNQIIQLGYFEAGDYLEDEE